MYWPLVLLPQLVWVSLLEDSNIFQIRPAEVPGWFLLGFAMSLLAMYLMEGKGKVKVKSVLIYGAISLALVIAASLYSLSYFNEHGGDGHSHDHGTPAKVMAPSIKEGTTSRIGLDL
jgi:hypothetical protein